MGSAAQAGVLHLYLPAASRRAQAVCSAPANLGTGVCLLLKKRNHSVSAGESVADNPVVQLDGDKPGLSLTPCSDEVDPSTPRT